MRAPAVVLCLLASACATPGPRAGPAGLDEAAARAVLGRFAQALEEGRPADAHALLSARWRAAYTPGRLALDFAGAGPLAAEAAARVRAGLAAGSPLLRTAESARLPLDGSRAAVLVAEAGVWRVDALE